MHNRRNYYRILHVQRDAPTPVIRASYRAVMHNLSIHPDLGGQHAAAALVNEAFETLIDPDRRAAYDRAEPAAGLEDRDRREWSTAPDAPVAPSCALCGAGIAASVVMQPDGVCVSCGSPVYPAQRLQSDTASRRAVERVPRDLPMTFRLATSGEVSLGGRIEDVSLTGMRFVSAVGMEVGDRLRIDCDFCSAVGVVRRLTPGTGRTWGMLRYGVEFLTLLIRQPRGSLVSSRA